MRRKRDDYFEEEDQQTENYEKPQKDPLLRKLNWLILIFLPQGIVSAIGLVMLIIQFFF